MGRHRRRQVAQHCAYRMGNGTVLQQHLLPVGQPERRQHCERAVDALEAAGPQLQHPAGAELRGAVRPPQMQHQLSLCAGRHRGASLKMARHAVAPAPLESLIAADGGQCELVAKPGQLGRQRPKRPGSIAEGLACPGAGTQRLEQLEQTRGLGPRRHADPALQRRDARRHQRAVAAQRAVQCSAQPGPVGDPGHQHRERSQIAGGQATARAELEQPRGGGIPPAAVERRVGRLPRHCNRSPGIRPSGPQSVNIRAQHAGRDRVTSRRSERYSPTGVVPPGVRQKAAPLLCVSVAGRSGRKAEALRRFGLSRMSDE